MRTLHILCDWHTPLIKYVAWWLAYALRQVDYLTTGVQHSYSEATDTEELDKKSLQGKVIPESESTLSFHKVPSLPTPRLTASPQPPSRTLSPDLPVSNLPLSESSHSPSVPLHNLPELSHAIPGPSQEIRGDVGELNIIEGSCTRKPSWHKEDYIAALSTPPEQLHAYHEVYAVGAFHQDL